MSRTTARVALCGIGLLVAGCSGGTPTVVPPGSMSPTPSAAVSPSTAARPAQRSPSVTTVTQDANGHTVTLHKGDRLRVVLSSTYWRFASITSPAVLREVGDPMFAPGSSCVPGGGCGTVTGIFAALAPGRVDLKAGRTSCGEARACVGNTGRFQITVVVSAS
jgi:hypothetical protein